MCHDGGGGGNGNGDITRVPYQPGTELRLEVVQDCDAGGGRLPLTATMSAVVARILSMTMSSVLDVVITGNGGGGSGGGGDESAGRHYVLKLYDRRFGRDLRKIDGRYVAHTAADEAAFEAAIRGGDMDGLLHALDEDSRSLLMQPVPWCYLDGSTGGRAKYEAALWQECRDAFDSETAAYAQLRPVQGQTVPRLYAHVRLPASGPSKPASSSTSSPFLDTPGILLQRIPGYSLWDLPAVTKAEPRMWQRVVQAAVDAVCDINARGVLLCDCAPRNVVVDAAAQAPFVVDLAHSSLRPQLLQKWREDGSTTDDEDGETQYWELVRDTDNHGALGDAMTERVRRAADVELTVVYPDYDRLIEALYGQPAGAESA